jgi:hypothetical protein
MIGRGMLAPERGIFERAPTRAFGHSTGGTRYTPFTRRHVRSFRGFQAAVLAQAVVGRGLADLVRHRSLVVQGNLDLSREDNGVVHGYSSAVMIARTPWLVRQRMLPALHVLRTPSLPDKLAGIGEALLRHRPRSLGGIPEFVVGSLRELCAGPAAAEVRERLSRVTTYFWSGTPLGPYRAFLERQLAPGCVFFDAVSSTEGPIGIQAEREGVYRAALSHTLLLFTPPGEPDRKLFVWELAPGEDYDLYLGSFAGYQGFAGGDRIRVLSRAPLRFALLPRKIDVESTWRLLGAEVSDFCIYRDAAGESVRVLVEAPAPPPQAALEALAARLHAARATVRLLPEGSLSRAAVAASARGLIKLPWIHQSHALHEELEKLAA